MALTINSLTASAVVFCQPVQLTWTGGQPPYFITLVSPNGGATTYETIVTNTTDMSARWVVDLAAGSDFVQQIRDFTGKIEYSGESTVQSNPSADSSCVTNSVALSGAAPSTTASVPTGGASASGASTTPAGSASKGADNASSSGSAKPSGSSSGSASKSTNGAGRKSISAIALAGVMALVGAALF